MRTEWDDLIEALDHYRTVQSKWDTATSQSGFYDPCDSQRDHYNQDIKDASEKLEEVFGELVRRHGPGCQCPDQPLG